MLERFFHNKWWDYSSRRFNLKGYICLEFSILWGVAVLFAVEVVHPAVAWFAGLFSELWGTVFVSLCLALLIADLVITVLQVFKLNRILGEIDRAAERMRKGSDLIGSGVASATLFVDKKAKRAGCPPPAPLFQRLPGPPLPPLARSRKARAGTPASL